MGSRVEPFETGDVDGKGRSAPHPRRGAAFRSRSQAGSRASIGAETAGRGRARKERALSMPEQRVDETSNSWTPKTEGAKSPVLPFHEQLIE